MSKDKSINEFKVGILIILFAILGFYVLFFMGKVGQKNKGIKYVIQFDQVSGLSKGDSVRYAGVDIGSVEKVTIRRSDVMVWNEEQGKFVQVIGKDGKPLQGDRAFVTIVITDPSIFPTGKPVFTTKTYVTVSTSFMNEKWIEIKPLPGGEPMDQNAPLYGHSPVTMDEFFAKSEKILDKVDEAVISFNNIMGDPKTQKDIKSSLDNFAQLTSNLNDSTKTINEKVVIISNKLVSLIDNANSVLNNVNTQVSRAGGNFDLVSKDVRVLTSDLKGVTGTLNRMVKNNEGDVNMIVKNLLATSKSLNRTMTTIEKFVGNEQLNEDLLATVHNIRNASEQAVGIANDLRAVTSDGQIREDLKIAIHEARSASEGANRLIRGVNNTLGIKQKPYKPLKGESGVKSKTESTEESKDEPKIDRKKFFVVDVDAEYDDKKDETAPNINALILPDGKWSVRLGIDRVGFDNLWNAQYRMKMGAFKPKAGLIRSKLGGGVDVNVGKNADISVDGYNTRDFQVDLTGKVRVTNGFYVHGGVRDVFDKKKRSAVFGAGKRF